MLVKTYENDDPYTLTWDSTKQMFKRLLQYLKNKESRSAAFLFLLNAFIFGSWSVRIPDIKSALDISEGQLGLALFAIPVGVVIFSPLTGMAMNKLGTGKVAIVSGVFQSLCLAALAFPQSLTQLMAVLFFYGIGNGMLDISMNGVVSAIEKQQNKILMSTSHGFWSLGAMVAAFGSGFIAGANIPLLTHLPIAAALAAIGFMLVSKNVWTLKDDSESKFKLIWPGWRLIILIGIVFIVFMVEGGIGEWAALFYEKVLQTPEWIWGFGFGTFSGAMAIARFAGDDLMAKFKQRSLLLSGCGAAAIGLFIFGFGHSLWLNTLSMILTGLACSVLVPIVFREAGKGGKVTPGLGLALVGTLGYAGFLVGPPVIGLVAEAKGLNTSFWMLSGLMIVAGLLALFTRE